jgi:DNA-binding NarL/FixJ family response regulator
MIKSIQDAADGIDIYESAATGGLKYSGIRRRRARAMERLGADNMAHAVAMAMRRGLVK